MRASVNRVYGPPSLISIEEIEKPTVKSNEVMVKVHYSSVNRTDCGFLRGKPFIARFFTGIPKPKYSALGCEFSGVVESVGVSVKRFKVGDRVFGFDDSRFGGHAEYKTINEDAMIQKVPKNITLQQAAVALEGAHYALFYIYKMPKSDDTKVFVNGGTGAIGSAGIQILKAMGYYLEASATTKQVEQVKKLGADVVIDWQKNDIAKSASRCDVYFDAVGKSSFKQARKILKPGGMYMSSELGAHGQNPLLTLINPIQKRFTKCDIFFPIPKTRRLESDRIVRLMEKGEFTPLIDKQYSFEQIPQAFTYVETGKKNGNVLVRIDQG